MLNNCKIIKTNKQVVTIFDVDLVVIKTTSNAIKLFYALLCNLKFNKIVLLYLFVSLVKLKILTPTSCFQRLQTVFLNIHTPYEHER